MIRLFLFLSCILYPAAGLAGVDRPNILFFFADDLYQLLTPIVNP